MRKSRFLLLGVLAVLVVFMGCMAHVHTIGNGPQGSEQVVAKQWYALWGLMPISVVDTHAMAGDKKNYEIKTETSVGDFIISIFTSIVTINCRTVTVTK